MPVLRRGEGEGGSFSIVFFFFCEKWVFFFASGFALVSATNTNCARTVHTVATRMHINKEKWVIGWIIRAAVETEQRRRDERGVDTPRRAQPRKAE